ncbi:MAG: glutamate--tRNA ligase, partial [Chitinophagaceae bacterium]|nr:glutamate--tRNA ligase [Chitinophagaceae bacterium]
FNHEWIKRSDATRLLPDVKKVLADNGVSVSDDTLLSTVINLVKDRCTLLTDFYEQTKFFFATPAQDLEAVKPKWNEAKKAFFLAAIAQMEAASGFAAAEQEAAFKELATQHNIKPGELMMPLRIMLVGGKFGPGVFDIAAVIGKNETIHRIQLALQQLDIA